jgi:cytochrome oxidase Cu insertion factor (SCO1/SenC/PrrC family)
VKSIALLAGLLVAGAITVGALFAAQPSNGPAQRSEGPYRGTEPPPGIRVPDATMRSYRGGTVSLKALEGKVLVLTFLDTRCTESCPIIASEIGSAMPLLSPSERGEAKAMAISVHPRLDTPASIRSFLRRRHALGKLDFLTGSVRQLRPVWRAFHVLPAIDTGSADVHSADVRIFDRAGIWVSTLHAGVDLTPANLVHDIRVALREEAR